ncbi:type IV pilin-like G/H family protein [Leptolyngbyaceae cyanobacterium UHCC 1019]
MNPSSNRKKGLPVIVWILIATGVLYGFITLVIKAISCGCAPPPGAEPRQHVGTMLRAEQAYFLEYRKFTPSLNELQVGIPSESTNYRYALTLQDGSPQPVMITAVPKKPGLRSYTGVVFANGTGQADMTVTQICETKQPSPTPPVMPIAPQNISEPIPCPPGSQPLK